MESNDKVDAECVDTWIEDIKEKIASIKDDTDLRNIGRSISQKRPAPRSFIGKGVTIAQDAEIREKCCDAVQIINTLIDIRRSELWAESAREDVKKLTESIYEVERGHPALSVLAEQI